MAQIKIRVGILGTQGSGKTVFLSALTKRLSEIEEGKPYIVPQGQRTEMHTAAIWDELFCTHQWPESTTRAVKTDWTFHSANQQTLGVELIEWPGQDLEPWMRVENPLNENWYQEDWYQEIIEVQEDWFEKGSATWSSDIFFFLIDFGKIIRESSTDKRREEEKFLVSILESLPMFRARVAIILSNSQDWAHLLGDLQEEALYKWIEINLPDFYSVLEKDKDRISIFPVTAVGQTQTKEGNTIPDENFSDKSMETVCDWFAESIVQSYASRKENLVSDRKTFITFLALSILSGSSIAWFDGVLWKWIAGIVAGVFFVFFLLFVLGGDSREKWPEPPAPKRRDAKTPSSQSK